MGSQRTASKGKRNLNSSFGRGSVEKNTPGGGKILNLSLSPNQMAGSKSQHDQGFEGGQQLSEVSEEIVDMYGNSNFGSIRSSKYSSKHSGSKYTGNSKSSQRDMGRHLAKENREFVRNNLHSHLNKHKQGPTGKWKQTMFQPIK